MLWFASQQVVSSCAASEVSMVGCRCLQRREKSMAHRDVGGDVDVVEAQHLDGASITDQRNTRGVVLQDRR